MKRRLRTIAIAFTISFLLMAGLAFFSVERLGRFISYSDQVDHTNEVIRAIYKVEGNIKDIDRAERGYMINGDTALLRALKRNMDTVMASMATLKKLTDDNQVQQRNLILLKSSLAMRIAAVRDNLDYIENTHSSAPSIYYTEGRKATMDCARKLREMHNEENRLFSERFRNEQFYQALASSSLRYLLSIFFIATLGLFLLMMVELRKRILYQHELQSRLHDLKRSHIELEQIAYVASHDLQEPLRKIQIFANRLLWKKKAEIDPESRETMERINVSATRMQELIEDLVNLTSLIKDGNSKEQVDMNRPLKYALMEHEDRIVDTGASISYDHLPEIKGYSNQLQILFKALLDNALKFTRDGVKPVISIKSEVTDGTELTDINPQLLHRRFIRITIADNGIGFDNKFVDKMFQIFQQLHNNQNEGKGIGLAMCQRVMANHEGYILGYGKVNVGATFKLFFPLAE